MSWHLVTFKDAYDRLDLLRAEVIIPFGLASMLLQAVFFAWAYPKLFSTRRDEWLASAARFAGIFATLAWSFAVLPVAAKYRMSSVTEFLKLETAFTILQFAIVSPLIALAYRGDDRAAAAADDEAMELTCNLDSMADAFAERSVTSHGDA